MPLTVHTESLSSIPADPLRLLDGPDLPADGQRWAWLAPDGRALVGWGDVLGTVGGPPRSLAEARARAFGALGRAAAIGNGSEHLRFFAGQRFDLAAGPTEPGSWAGFPAAGVVLPEVALQVDPPLARLVLVATAGSPNAARVLAGRARALADDLAGPAGPAVAGGAPAPIELATLPVAERSDLRARVVAALAAIADGTVGKVVVATARTMRPAVAPDPATVLRRLRVSQPGCFHYLVQPRPGAALVGASPERLVAVDGARLRTMALAGSAPRGLDPAADAALGAALQASAKDRAEHQWVVDAIRAELAPVTTFIHAPAAPRLCRLATIQHLETPIEATLSRQGDILDLAARLHPTPALAGTPREAALAAIRRIEGDARGWYGGLVGWLDAAGNGDLTVAIRCLLLADGAATAFAGAGIVAGSDPEREVAEITLKLGAALGVVGS